MITASADDEKRPPEEKKPGPNAERLVIEEDPEEALKRLLKVRNEKGEFEKPDRS